MSHHILLPWERWQQRGHIGTVASDTDMWRRQRDGTAFLHAEIMAPLTFIEAVSTDGDQVVDVSPAWRCDSAVVTVTHV